MKKMRPFGVLTHVESDSLFNKEVIMKKIALIMAVLAILIIAPACVTPDADNTAKTRERYSEIYADVSMQMLEMRDTSEVSTTALVPTTNRTNVYSTGALLYFVSELYKNEAFVVSDKPAKFTCSYKNLAEQSYYIAFRPVINEAESKVVGEFFVENKGLGDKNYIRIDVDYDFEKEEIIAFELFVCVWDTDAGLLHNVYKDGVLYKGDDANDQYNQDSHARMLAYKEDYNTALQDAIEIESDFTEEYTATMEIVYSKMQ